MIKLFSLSVKFVLFHTYLILEEEEEKDDLILGFFEMEVNNNNNAEKCKFKKKRYSILELFLYSIYIKRFTFAIFTDFVSLFLFLILFFYLKKINYYRR